MPQKPIIGIVAGEIINKIETWANVNYGQSKPYSDAVIRAGGVPIILPLTEDMEVIRSYYDQCDGLLFAGGNDVRPEHYHESPHESVEDLSELRDTQEMTMLRWALADDKPILAICRGMQMLNVTCGGSLYQDIPSQLPGKQNHDASKEYKNTTYLAHELSIEAGSRLAAIMQLTSIPANSRHHQAVKKVGRGLQINAYAEDGIIEGLEMPGKYFVIGIQSHPEGLEPSVETRWRRLFSSFTAACATEPQRESVAA